MSRTRKLLCGFGALAALLALSQLAGAAGATPHAQTGTQRVIVVLKNQEARLPATRSLIAQRRSAIRQAQAPVTRLLSSVGARNVHPYTVIDAVSATTNPFDSAMSSPTGDLWFASTTPSSLGSFNPTLTNSGQWASIPVTITPNAPSGSMVHGTLYIDDTARIIYQFFGTVNGNDVAAIPYQYKVK